VIARPATTTDVPAMVALVNSAYRGDRSRVGWTTEADLLGGQRVDAERLTETIARPGNVILLHERDHVPTTQGAGLGRQMLTAAERWAMEHFSSRTMHMTVIVQRAELIAWYERRGYHRTGERKPFPYGDERFGRPRRDDLAFEVLVKPLSR
jgi:GNAT superfamily N-acetyltransferase